MVRRPVLILGLIAVLFRGPAATWAGDTPPFAPPAPPKDPAALGLHIQRTMTLLATSTPEHRHKVRVLFYGQSITEQDWSRQVADDLRRRFPNADLEIENRAIGGFASQLLIRPAEHDLYPFYPDLLIFHVYGANQEYEQLIKAVRSRTTAEVLMQKDHVTRWPPAVIDERQDKGMWWDNLMNHHLLPEIARKYGCGLADIRGPWLDYLKANHLEPKALLKDDVHLNDHGNFLMAELIKRDLVYRPDLADDEWVGLARTVEVGKDVAWDNGTLTLEFEGNRVDAIADPSSVGTTAPARILVDGKKPSEFPAVYRITRPTPGPWSLQTVTRVDHDKPLVLEDWTLRVTAVNADSTSWQFDVTGSKTGPDGSGSNRSTFVSRSGRVKIEPGSWFPFKTGNVPVGYEIRWKVLPMFVDEYRAPKVDDPSREATTTLLQGISNARHTLQILAEGPVPIRAFRVYRPPVK